jgi:transposase
MCLQSSACRRITRCVRFRALVDGVLCDISREFDRLYARVGRPSTPPERLLRAQLLQIFYSIRSERLLMEQLDYNLLFRWFVGSLTGRKNLSGMEYVGAYVLYAASGRSR